MNRCNFATGLQENDLFRFRQNNASIFCRNHLPLNRKLRLLGKAFGNTAQYSDTSGGASSASHLMQFSLIYRQVVTRFQELPPILCSISFRNHRTIRK